MKTIYATTTKRQFNSRLTSKASLDTTVEQLETNSDLEVSGHAVDTRMIFSILVYAATNGISIEAACRGCF